MRKREKRGSKASWREFERLVTRIEAALAPQHAIVKSPDRIPDAVTQALREVDASIRCRVGTTDILMIIECRDRKNEQDSLWIEQLATKQRHLNAAKCIAVSSKGFTAPAIAKAKSLGIEVRHLKHIEDDVIREWAPTRAWFFSYRVGGVSLTFFDENDNWNLEFDKQINDELASQYYIEDECLQSKTSSRKISISQYIVDTINHCYDAMPDEKKLAIKENHKYTWSYVGEPLYYIESSKGRLDVAGIVFDVTFTNFEDYALKTRAFNYASSQADLVKGIEVDARSRQGEMKKLTIHTDTSSKTSRFSIWQIPGDDTVEDFEYVQDSSTEQKATSRPEKLASEPKVSVWRRDTQ